MRGFYRGVASPLVALTILNMMNFTVYAKSTELLNLKDSDNKAVLRKNFEPRVFIAGSASGFLASVISTPFEHVKIQMQLANISSTVGSSSTTAPGNSFQVARQILSHGSVPLLYRGHCINTLREVCFLGTYFFVYEHGKLALTPFLPTPIAVALSGGVSGAIGWFVSFPLDTLKSNIQGVGLSGPRLPAVAIARRLLASKGVVGLYSGVHASVARAFLVSSSRFTAYELTQCVLQAY